jgi:hypothetical protein
MKRIVNPAVMLFLALLILIPATSHGRGVYQTSDAFLSEVFSGKVPETEVMWLSDDIQTEIKKILGHPYKAQRLRYWGVPGKSVWILDEIGKEEPITAGIVVSAGKIQRVKILEYRESRGDEVRHEFFIHQFQGAGLNSAQELDRPIDGISGATLSVSAITRLSALALYLHGRSQFAP